MKSWVRALLSALIIWTGIAGGYLMGYHRAGYDRHTAGLIFGWNAAVSLCQKDFKECKELTD